MKPRSYLTLFSLEHLFHEPSSNLRIKRRRGSGAAEFLERAHLVVKRARNRVDPNQRLPMCIPL